LDHRQRDPLTRQLDSMRLAFDNLSSRDFFSARIGCQTFGVYGIDLAALCLRRSGR
jgi:hypothetical protein